MILNYLLIFSSSEVYEGQLQQEKGSYLQLCEVKS